MSAVFITGAGTDVGKTFVTCGLVRRLRASGIPVAALKPVVSGFAGDAAAGSDSGLLLAALGRAIAPETLDEISPWRFRAALSPDMAAAREGRAIDFETLVEFSLGALGAIGDADDGLAILEGVGGIHAPLDETHTVADWIEALGIPVVLVGGSYLGALSHTLSALEALDVRGMDVRAVVVSESSSSAVDLAETVATLARFTHETPVIGLPRGAEAEAPAFAELARLVTATPAEDDA